MKVFDVVFAEKEQAQSIARGQSPPSRLRVASLAEPVDIAIHKTFADLHLGNFDRTIKARYAELKILPISKPLLGMEFQNALADSEGRRDKAKGVDEVQATPRTSRIGVF